METSLHLDYPQESKASPAVESFQLFSWKHSLRNRQLSTRINGYQPNSREYLSWIIFLKFYSFILNDEFLNIFSSNKFTSLC